MRGELPFMEKKYNPPTDHTLWIHVARDEILLNYWALAEPQGRKERLIYWLSFHRRNVTAKRRNPVVNREEHLYTIKGVLQHLRTCLNHLFDCICFVSGAETSPAGRWL